MPDAHGRPPLTEKQRRFLDHLRDYIRRHGRPPSYEDLAQLLDVASSRSVGHYVEELEKKGYLKRGGHRGLEIVGEPALWSLPVLGPVAAGRPLPSPSAATDWFDFRAEFGGADVFMLRVAGESMIEDHIAPGDLVVIRRADRAETGETVVCRVGDEYTLKVYREVRKGRWLFPRNARMEPVRVGEGTEVVGVLIGVVRTRRPPAGQGRRVARAK